MIVDEHVEPLTLDDAPDLVVIQVYITNAYRAYSIADHYRSQGAFVCLGGLQASLLFPTKSGLSRRTPFFWARRTILSQSSCKTSASASRIGFTYQNRAER